MYKNLYHLDNFFTLHLCNRRIYGGFRPA